MTTQPAAPAAGFFCACAADFRSEPARIPGRRRACYAHRLPATGAAR
ncbi:hypothetical protein BURCENBC7_AP4664 [Burkholderia cenocepacia BC7]|nr:hypothetical protein BURCENBC7_AP4664 [Burkholderia cenocepacia BC7]